MRLITTLILPAFILAPLNGQTGGDNTYEFLNLSHSAFATATGGITVSQQNDDLSLPFYNPSLLNPLMESNLSMSFSSYFAGITYGYVSWAGRADSRGSFAGGLSFVNYGRFTASDAAGNINGTFNASEYALNIIFSRSVDSVFTAGINVKPVISSFERYFSAGLCIDLGVHYNNEKLLFEAGMAIRNVGFQFRSYTGDGGEVLPFEIIAGATKRLAHAPFRFTLTVRHLEKPDLTTDYDTSDDVNPGGTGEDILRHMILGIELVPTENFWAGAGFNYQRRAELRAAQRPGTAGFSWGFGFRAKAFSFAYGRDTFHLAGSSNHLTLTLRPEFIFKSRSR